EPVVAKDVADLGALLAGHHLGLVPLPRQLGPVGLGLTLGREIAAEAHRDRPGGDLGEAADDDQQVARGGAGGAGGEREGRREAVREPEDHVTHRTAAGEVLFAMSNAHGHGSILVDEPPSRIDTRAPCACSSSTPTRVRSTAAWSAG